MPYVSRRSARTITMVQRLGTLTECLLSGYAGFASLAHHDDASWPSSAESTNNRPRVESRGEAIERVSRAARGGEREANFLVGSFDLASKVDKHHEERDELKDDVEEGGELS